MPRSLLWVRVISVGGATGFGGGRLVSEGAAQSRGQSAVERSGLEIYERCEGRNRGGKLCSFRFVDLRGSGKLSLVAVYDYGGTGPDCDDVGVIDKDSRGVEFYQADKPNYSSSGVGHIIKDLNGDGHFELVLEGRLTYAGVKYPGICMVFWPRVYAWTGSGYTEVSAQYPKYYEAELASVKEKIAAIDAAEAAAQLSSTAAPTSVPAAPPAVRMEGHWLSPSQSPQIAYANRPPETATEPSAAAAPAPEAAPKPDPGDLDCLKAEAARMERLLGISKDAGMLDAIRWANSDDPDHREFAGWIFGELRTPEAMEYEQTLSRDSDREVADAAKWEIQHWGKNEHPAVFGRLTLYPSVAPMAK